MKAFIVIGWWSYEGYDRPTAVYSSRELADAAVKTAYSGYNGVDVIEYRQTSDQARNVARYGMVLLKG